MGLPVNINKLFMALMLLLPNPFREMGVWRKTMESQKLGNSPGPGPKVIETKKLPKSERHKQSVVGQSRMR